MKTKSFTLFSCVKNNNYVSVVISIKENGTFASKNSIKFTNYKGKKEYDKQYRLNNAHKRKQYYNNNRKIILNNKIKYYKINKEKILNNAKKYYINNKEKILERAKQYYKSTPNKHKLWARRKNAKRKGWGINPINEPFENCHFHHLHINGDHSIGIYIPMDLHKGIYHSYKNEESMEKINKIAMDWYDLNE